VDNLIGVSLRHIDFTNISQESAVSRKMRVCNEGCNDYLLLFEWYFLDDRENSHVKKQDSTSLKKQAISKWATKCGSSRKLSYSSVYSIWKKVSQLPFNENSSLLYIVRCRVFFVQTTSICWIVHFCSCSK